MAMPLRMLPILMMLPAILSAKTLVSPDGRARLEVTVDEAGAPIYSLTRDGKPLLADSRLGFTVRDQPPLDSGFVITGARHDEHESTWETPYGQSRWVTDRHRSLTVDFERSAPDQRRLSIEFRLFDDGMAFRYTLPRQPGLESVEILAERSEFNFTGDNMAWWTPIDFELQEQITRRDTLSRVPESSTPFTLRTQDGTYLAVHEAGLEDYPGMALTRTSSNGFTSELAPWPDGVKVRGKTPIVSPWRTIQFSDRVGGLIESNLLLNLNEPSRIADTSWIRPVKFMGIWWSIHLGFETFVPGPHQAATTEKAMRMIDACVRLGADALLVEGWNKGWEFRNRRDDVPDFFEPNDGYDIVAVARYAQEKGIELIMHHETFGNIAHYEAAMDKAFAWCRELGIRYVKGGYAGKINPPGQLRQGQFMIAHYRRQIEAAAAHGVMLNIHEPAKLVGFSRTYPNLLTGEAVRGMEFEAWSAGNAPAHTVTIPFTRGLAGPVDYNFGIFDLKFESLKSKDFNWRSKRRNYPRNPGPSVKTTRAKQLALYVIIYSPMQMLPDLPENYEGRPEFQFIRDVPVDWDETRVLDAEIGEYITVARKDRNSEAWFIGSATNEKARRLSTPLDFLPPGRTYLATIYADGPDAHWDDNPTPVSIVSQRVTSDTVLDIELAAGGGQAISLVPED